MSKDLLKQILFGALKESKSQDVSSRASTLTKQLGQLLNQHFKSKATAIEVAAIIKSRTVQSPLSLTTAPRAKTRTKSWVSWEVGADMTKKNSNEPLKNGTKAGVVAKKGEADDPNEDLDDLDDVDFARLAELTPQAIIDYFGTFPSVVEFAKEMGFEIDVELDPMDYLVAFKNEISDSVEALQAEDEDFTGDDDDFDEEEFLNTVREFEKPKTVAQDIYPKTPPPAPVKKTRKKRVTKKKA